MRETGGLRKRGSTENENIRTQNNLWDHIYSFTPLISGLGAGTIAKSGLIIEDGLMLVSQLKI